MHYLQEYPLHQSKVRLISLTDSQITKYEKKHHSPLIFLELYPKPITLKCTPELYAKCMGEEHQHDIQENEHDER